ncbi:MAG: YkgJ family cysteine cluster protein [Candidatus Scalindua sediminis]|nr:YkgJ family cysteine cluster protein [Candidatus Scalindua sediminis]
MITYAMPSSEQLYFWENLESIKTLIDCSTCSHCCDRDNFYLFPFEVDYYKRIGIDVIEIYGVNFLKKTSSTCPFLSNDKQKCTIYEKRPISCRLFPLEIILDERNVLAWAHYKADYCLKHSLLQASDLNVAIYFLIKKLAPLFKPHSNFLYKHNTVEDTIDLYKSEHNNYSTIKKF